MSKKLPDYLLERLALGELSDKEAREARERLANEPDGLRRLADLQASNEKLLARHPPEAVAKEIQRRRRAVVVQIRNRRVAWLMASAGVLAAAVLAVVLQPDGVRPKGDSQLLVYAHRGGQNVLLKDGDTARAGETVQLAYRAKAAGYGAILSLDGAGVVTLHLPAKDGEAVRVVPGKNIELDSSYELDAAPGFERFFLITSESPFHTSVVVEAARKLAARGDRARTEPLALTTKFDQKPFLLRKAGP